MNNGQRTVTTLLAVVAVMLTLNLIVTGSPPAEGQVAAGPVQPKVLSAQAFQVVDEDGKLRAVFGALDGGVGLYVFSKGVNAGDLEDVEEFGISLTYTDYPLLMMETPDGESVTIVDYGTRNQNPRTWPIAGGSTDDPKRLEIVEYGPQPVVRDFIKFEVKIAGREIYPWIFNVADAMLVVGVGILLMNFWRERKHHEPAEGA